MRLKSSMSTCLERSWLGSLVIQSKGLKYHTQSRTDSNLTLKIKVTIYLK
nr:MAG TPA: hypothetical protein [Caudoviricetes sp.]